MKSREELRNDYEEALFAMVMDDIMELEGEALIAERERLAASDEYKVPDDVDKRCLELINHSFEEHKKKENKRRTRKAWRTVLIAALVSCLCFMTAYATVPSVRSAAKDLVIQFYHTRTSILPGEENSRLFLNYDFWYIPDGFVVEEERHTEVMDYCKYASGEAFILIRVYNNCVNEEFTVDSEDADSVESIILNGFEGVVVEKQDRVHITVIDTQVNNQIQVVASGVDKQTALMIVENINRND